MDEEHNETKHMVADLKIEFSNAVENFSRECGGTTAKLRNLGNHCWTIWILVRREGRRVFMFALHLVSKCGVQFLGFSIAFKEFFSSLLLLEIFFFEFSVAFRDC